MQSQKTACIIGQPHRAPISLDLFTLIGAGTLVGGHCRTAACSSLDGIDRNQLLQSIQTKPRFVTVRRPP